MPLRTVWSPERRLLTAGLIGLITAVAFEGMAVPTVLPATVDDLGGLDLYGWAFAAFWLTNLVGITLAGGDADAHGPLRPFVTGIVLFAAGLAISGLAYGMPMVIAGRAVQGLGAGAIGAVVYAVIARAYDSSAIPRMLALNSSAWVVPGLVGPALAAQIVVVTSWRWVFLGLAPLVLLLGAAVVGPMRRLQPVSGSGSAAGARALASVGLAAGSGLLLASLAMTQLPLAVPVAVLGGVLAIPAARRLLPAGTLTAHRGTPAVIAGIGVIAFGFFGTEAFVPLVISTVREAGIVVGGLALSCAAVTWTAGSWIQARLAPRGWRRGLVRAGALLIVGGIGLEAVVLLPSVPVALGAAAWAAAGLGMGLAYSTLTLLVLETATPGEEGAASASLQLLFTLGTAAGSGVGGALVALGAHGVLPLAAAIAVSDLVMMCVVLLCAALAGRIPERGPGTPPPHAADLALASPAGSLSGAAREEP